MFGTLKPQLKTLPHDQRHDYQHLYCGLCAGLGQTYDQATRATLNHDMVFVVALIEGLQISPDQRTTQTRCPMMPLHHKPTIAPDRDSVRFASALSMLLADQWLEDKAQDGARPARHARRLIATRVQGAQQLWDDLGLSALPLEQTTTAQAKLERQNKTSIERASQPTATLLAAIFSQIAALPGIAKTPGLERQLSAIGEALGQVIYGLDALKDLPKDLARGHFNPCITPRADGALEADAARLQRCVKFTQAAHQRLSSALEALPLRRHRPLIEHIAISRQGRQLDAAITRAQALLLPTITQSPKVRLQLAMFTIQAMFLSMWAAARQLVAFERQALRLTRQQLLGPAPAQATRCATPAYAAAGANHSLSISASIQPAMMSSAQDEEQRKQRQDDLIEGGAEGCECCCDSMECCCQLPDCCSSCSDCHCPDCPCSDCPCGDCCSGCDCSC